MADPQTQVPQPTQAPVPQTYSGAYLGRSTQPITPSGTLSTQNDITPTSTVVLQTPPPVQFGGDNSVDREYIIREEKARIKSEIVDPISEEFERLKEPLKRKGKLLGDSGVFMPEAGDFLSPSALITPDKLDLEQPMRHVLYNMNNQLPTAGAQTISIPGGELASSFQGWFDKTAKAYTKNAQDVAEARYQAAVGQANAVYQVEMNKYNEAIAQQKEAQDVNTFLFLSQKAAEGSPGAEMQLGRFLEDKSVNIQELSPAMLSMPTDTQFPQTSPQLSTRGVTLAIPESSNFLQISVTPRTAGTSTAQTSGGTATTGSAVAQIQSALQPASQRQAIETWNQMVDQKVTKSDVQIDLDDPAAYQKYLKEFGAERQAFQNAERQIHADAYLPGWVYDARQEGRLAVQQGVTVQPIQDFGTTFTPEAYKARFEQYGATHGNKALMNFLSGGSLNSTATFMGEGKNVGLTPDSRSVVYINNEPYFYSNYGKAGYELRDTIGQIRSAGSGNVPLEFIEREMAKIKTQASPKVISPTANTMYKDVMEKYALNPVAIAAPTSRNDAASLQAGSSGELATQPVDFGGIFTPDAYQTRFDNYLAKPGTQDISKFINGSPASAALFMGEGQSVGRTPTARDLFYVNDEPYFYTSYGKKGYEVRDAIGQIRSAGSGNVPLVALEHELRKLNDTRQSSLISPTMNAINRDIIETYDVVPSATLQPGEGSHTPGTSVAIHGFGVPSTEQGIAVAHPALPGIAAIIAHAGGGQKPGVVSDPVYKPQTVISAYDQLFRPEYAMQVGFGALGEMDRQGIDTREEAGYAQKIVNQMLGLLPGQVSGNAPDNTRGSAVANAAKYQGTDFGNLFTPESYKGRFDAYQAKPGTMDIGTFIDGSPASAALFMGEGQNVGRTPDMRRVLYINNKPYFYSGYGKHGYEVRDTGGQIRSAGSGNVPLEYIGRELNKLGDAKADILISPTSQAINHEILAKYGNSNRSDAEVAHDYLASLNSNLTDYIRGDAFDVATESGKPVQPNAAPEDPGLFDGAVKWFDDTQKGMSGWIKERTLESNNPAFVTYVQTGVPILVRGAAPLQYQSLGGLDMWAKMFPDANIQGRDAALTEFAIGEYEGMRERPLEFGISTGIGLAFPLVGKGAGVILPRVAAPILEVAAPVSKVVAPIASKVVAPASQVVSKMAMPVRMGVTRAKTLSPKTAVFVEDKLLAHVPQTLGGKIITAGGYGLGAVYGVDVTRRVATAENPMRELGAISAVELIPMGIGGYAGSQLVKNVNKADDVVDAVDIARNTASRQIGGYDKNVVTLADEAFTMPEAVGAKINLGGFSKNVNKFTFTDDALETGLKTADPTRTTKGLNLPNAPAKGVAATPAGKPPKQEPVAIDYDTWYLTEEQAQRKGMTLYDAIRRAEKDVIDQPDIGEVVSQWYRVDELNARPIIDVQDAYRVGSEVYPQRSPLLKVREWREQRRATSVRDKRYPTQDIGDTVSKQYWVERTRETPFIDTSGSHYIGANAYPEQQEFLREGSSYIGASLRKGSKKSDIGDILSQQHRAQDLKDVPLITGDDVIHIGANAYPQQQELMREGTSYIKSLFHKGAKKSDIGDRLSLQQRAQDLKDVPVITGDDVAHIGANAYPQQQEFVREGTSYIGSLLRKGSKKSNIGDDITGAIRGDRYGPNQRPRTIQPDAIDDEVARAIASSKKEIVHPTKVVKDEKITSVPDEYRTTTDISTIVDDALPIKKIKNERTMGIPDEYRTTTDISTIVDDSLPIKKIKPLKDEKVTAVPEKYRVKDATQDSYGEKWGKREQAYGKQTGSGLKSDQEQKLLAVQKLVVKPKTTTKQIIKDGKEQTKSTTKPKKKYVSEYAAIPTVTYAGHRQYVETGDEQALLLHPENESSESTKLRASNYLTRAPDTLPGVMAPQMMFETGIHGPQDNRSTQNSESNQNQRSGLHQGLRIKPVQVSMQDMRVKSEVHQKSHSGMKLDDHTKVDVRQTVRSMQDMNVAQKTRSKQELGSRQATDSIGRRKVIARVKSIKKPPQRAMIPRLEFPGDDDDQKKQSVKASKTVRTVWGIGDPGDILFGGVKATTGKGATGKKKKKDINTIINLDAAKTISKRL